MTFRVYVAKELETGQCAPVRDVPHLDDGQEALGLSELITHSLS
jgi:hypothetical protein